MGQQVKVSRDLVFMGAADYTDNIKGNPSYEKVVLYDDFLGKAVDETNDWSVNESHGGTGAINAAIGGTYRLTTTATGDDKCELGSTLCWEAAKACVMEARIKIDHIETVVINVGWNEIAAEGDNELAAEIDSNDDAVNARSGEFAGFVYDTESDSDVWFMSNSISDDEETTALTGVAPVDATYETFRVALNTDGDATFYHNGVAVGFKVDAITSTTDLTPYIGVMTRTGARLLDIDYVKCWQNRV